MPRFPSRRTAAALAATFLVGACAMMQPANTVRFGGRLSGASEVPPVPTDGTGMLEATLNKETNQLKWKVTHSGLSGPARAAHFHGPAMAGQNVAPVLPFKSPDSPIEGEATLTPAQAADLLAGKWYVNVHTAKNPGGEIRAQVAPTN